MQKPHVQAKQICYFPSAGRCSATAEQPQLIMHNGFLGRQILSLQSFLTSFFFIVGFIAEHDTV